FIQHCTRITIIKPPCPKLRIIVKIPSITTMDEEDDYDPRADLDRLPVAFNGGLNLSAEQLEIFAAWRQSLVNYYRNWRDRSLEENRLARLDIQQYYQTLRSFHSPQQMKGM
ncbi:hypothetical protein KEM48_007820, partial [Puccinia striiformis f. sp. tritici PST-130]